MPDTPHNLEEDRRQGFIDRLLKKLMPNGTVMRRFIAAAYACGIISGVVGIKLIERTDDNASSGGKAICAIIYWGEETLQESTNINDANGGQARFRRLIMDMKNTGVRCDPPPQKIVPRG